MLSKTIQENGPVLPLGVLNPSGGFDKAFALKPFKARIDRHLGLWKEASQERYTPSQLIAMQVPKLLSLLVSDYGGKPVPVTSDQNSTPEGELLFHQAYFSDVMYMYLYARIQSIGSELECPIVCPNSKCKYSGMGVFDLLTSDVNVVENSKEVYRWIDLKRPFKLCDNKTLCRRVKVGPVLWSTLTKPGVMTGNVGSISLTTLQDSICCVNDDTTTYRLSDPEIDEMEKIDILRIDKLAGESLVGVNLNTTILCPQCKAPIVNPLNWGYESFFGTSLPSEN